MNAVDRAIGFFWPSWAASRALSRLKARHYEAASVGRRTSGWSKLGTDANAAAGGASLAVLRAHARDLVRNNSWARRGLRRICSNTVGWGIRPKVNGRNADRVAALWKLWAETTQCDAAGRLTFYGLQKLAMRAIAESGEVLIRRRGRRTTDGLAIPMQLQVLEPDFIDTGRDGIIGEAGGPIIQGVEFDALGNRVAYWLFDRHPGSNQLMSGGKLGVVSRRIPADGILHVYDQERAGQVRGPSWFASVDVKLHDFDEFEDATLMKAKIGACVTAFVTDLDGSGAGLGKAGTDDATGQPIDTLEPGMIIPLEPGKNVTFSTSPSTNDHQSYSATQLRAIAAGLPGITYEDLTGDYSQVNFSSARLGRIGARSEVEDLRWNMLIPQFCQPAFAWMIDTLMLVGEQVSDVTADWSPAPMPITDPDKELAAYQRAVRNGFMTWPQVIRELGYDPREQLEEIAEYNEAFDADDIVLDCDPRHTNAQGQQQIAAAPAGADDTAGADDATGAPH